MIKRNSTILCDVDGVLLHWLPAFHRYMNNQGLYSDNPEGYTVGANFGMTDDELVEYITIFNGGHWEFGTLTPYADAQYGIQELTKLGYRFVAITSCSTNTQAIALRRANLYIHFGDVFDAVHCIDVGNSKKTHLAEHEPTFWIEDHAKNAADGLEYGHDCILMAQNWNENVSDPRVKRCLNWAEIVEYIETGGRLKV